MARIMNIESKVDRAMRRLLNELYMSGFDKTMILRMFPIKPTIPEINRKCLKLEVLDDQRFEKIHWNYRDSGGRLWRRFWGLTLGGRELGCKIYLE